MRSDFAAWERYSRVRDRGRAETRYVRAR